MKIKNNMLKQNNKNINIRNTGLDILRCIAMFMIVVLHICVHGFKLSELEVGAYEATNYTTVMCFFTSVCSIAVNIFFMFSGYFDSKFNWKKILHLYGEVALYSGVCYIIYEFVIDKSGASLIRILLRLVKNCVLGFSWYWFIVAYIILYILSPFLKEYLDSISDKRVLQFAGIITLINVFFGFILESSAYGGPRTVLPAICMYILGYCIKRNESLVEKNRKIFFIAYIVSTILVFSGGILLIHYNQNAAWRCMTDYNNPLLICSSVALFSIFCGFSPKRKQEWSPLTYVSGSTFAVYLISDNTWTRQWLYSILNDIVPQAAGTINIILIVTVYALLIFWCCTLIDLLRRVVLKRFQTFFLVHRKR